ncbi:hypothetical protein Nepgr_018625 [Nepenthes gracilis]|uniref:Fe2OG dioxygenase domain-containing protein n=1 Tax=Nepenthes gracilis TaxID=150966 RepID=A0AAD3XU72_NEPGR|nr:hypothetical protein Nepgr_018625 [Nepenthes gracilis]
MAGYAPSAKIELQNKPVQEIAEGGGDVVPERYIHREISGAGSFDATLPYMDCAPIDLQLLSSSSPNRQEELDKLRSALHSWGCFQVVNHGMPASSMGKMREAGKQFFALPMEEKRKYSRPVDDLEGYGHDTFVSEDRILDWTDRLYLLAFPEERRRLKFWPEKPPLLREKLREYAIKSQEILELVLNAMALSLGLEEKSFLKQYGENGMIFARFNFYPRCPRPDCILGIKQHSDGSAVTIVLQDEKVEGLQVLKDDQWFKVPIIPDALFINAGDQVEIMSNGIFKSPVHRVVTNSESERLSVAMFCTPDPENEIGPSDELITDDRRQSYKKVKNYPMIYYHYYELGETPLSSVKI